MRRLLKSIHEPQSERAMMVSDILGAFALFVLFYAALHLPMMA